MNKVTHQRRADEVQALKARILDVTHEIALEEGWEAVTIRKISHKIRYSSPVIYRHFKNKQDILSQLYLRGLKLMQTYIEKAVGDSEIPREFMEKGALGYWDFAMEHPELYQLMFTSKASEYVSEELHSFGHELFEGGIEMVGHMNKSLNFDEKHDYLANYFSLLHGYSHLALNDRLYTEEGGRKDALKSMKRAVKRLVDMIYSI